MKHGLVLIILFFYFLVGCAELFSNIVVENVSPSDKKYRKVSPDSVVIFESEKKAPKGYLILARLKSTPGRCCDDFDQFLSIFRKEASELGADALIFVDVTEEKYEGMVLERPNEPNDLSPFKRWESIDHPIRIGGPEPKKYRGNALAVRLRS